MEKSWQSEWELAGHIAATVFLLSAESNGCWCSAHFLFLIQSGTPAHDQSHTVRVVLPTSVNVM